MNHIQQALNKAYGLLFSPFENRDPIWLMLWLSVLTAVLVLLVYKYLSSQEAIRAAKDRVRSHILEIRLFQDDPVLMGRAVRAALRANLTYLRLNMRPFLIVFAPLFLLLVQMEARFGYRPLLPNESAVIRSVWRSTVAVDQGPSPSLIPGDGLTLQSPPVRIRERNEIDWKIRADRMGTNGFVLETTTHSLPLQVLVSEGLLPISPRNVRQGSLDGIWHPASQPLPPEGDLLSVEVGYPRRDFHLLGAKMHWIWPFLILSLLAGYLLKGVFRVQF
jgi:hypothetical protein